MNYTRDIVIALIFCVGICRTNAQIITTISGPGNKIHKKNDQVDILPTITNASGVTVDDYGNVYVAEYWESSELLGSIFIFDPRDTSNLRAGVITKGQNIPTSPGHIPYPHGIALDDAGDIYVAGYYSHTVLKITPGGKITTVAGCGESGYSGDNGNAPAARLSLLNGIAVDHNGNIFVADEFNNVIRKVTAGGIITTFAGAGAAGYKGDGQPATHSLLNRPYGVAINKAGDLIFSDTYNNVIRKVGADGTISTIAGNGKEGYSGDHGPAIDACLNQPAGITTDNSGNIYVADEGNNAVRKIAANGVITTIAGNGGKGYGGDGGQAANASLSGPRDVAIDPMGNMYIADFGNHVIRKVAIPLPFNVTPLKTLPLATLPVTIFQMPLAFSHPITLIPVFVAPSPIASLPLLNTVTFPIRIPSVVASPSLAQIPVLITPLPDTQIPMLAAKVVSGVIPAIVTSPPLVAIPHLIHRPEAAGVKISMLSAKEMFVPIPINTLPHMVAIPSIVLQTPPIDEHAIPLLSVIRFPVTVPSVVSVPSPVAVPVVAVQTPAVKVPVLSAILLPGTTPSVVTPPSPVAVPLIFIRTPGAKIRVLSVVPMRLRVPFPDTLQQLVAIPVIDLPQQEDIPPPSQIEEDKVTVSINSNNTMTITSEKGSYTTFTITNMLGETILEKVVDAKQTNVDVTSLQPGNYYINLKSEKETKTLRFVKEN